MLSAHRFGSGTFVFSASMAAILTSSALAGPIWEGDLDDDAGATPGGAQVIDLNGSVIAIKGRLSGSGLWGGNDFIDMYLVRISAPTVLKISTAGGDNGGEAAFDSQLFLFQAELSASGQPFARAVLANNDAAEGNPGAFIGNASNDGSGFVLEQPGLYYIAITTKGFNPLNANGAPIFDGLNAPGSVPFGRFELFSGWGGEASDGGGEYFIRTSGVEGVPAPGALALLALAGLAGRSRRA